MDTEYDEFGPDPLLGLDSMRPDLDGMSDTERDSRITEFLALAEWTLAGNGDPTPYCVQGAAAAKRAIMLYRAGYYADAVRSSFAAGIFDSKYSLLWGLFDSGRGAYGKYDAVVRALYGQYVSQHVITFIGEPTEEDLGDALAEFEHFSLEVEEDDLAQAVAAWKDGQGYYVIHDETEFHTEGSRDYLRIIARKVAAPEA